MYKVYLKIILSVMLICAALPFFYLRNTETVIVTRLKKTAYQPKMEITGVTEASQSTAVKMSYPVYIKQSFVKEDSFVNKGQLLFTLDTEKMENAVKDYNFTEYTDAAVSLNKSTFLDINSSIYASESGFIRNLTAVDGAIVLSDEDMCVIESDDSIMLKITLGQEDYSRIAVGDTVQFCPNLSPNKSYAAIITDKTAKIRRETSLTGSKSVVDIFAQITNADDFIVSGLEVSGTVSKPVREIYTLPYEYINQDENGEYVTIFADGSPKKIYVETGIEMEDNAEILNSFSDDTLFIKNNQDLKGNLLLKYEN